MAPRLRALKIGFAVPPKPSCEQTGYNFGLDFFKENGYVLWLRLEVLAEESYVCPHWEPKDSEVRDQ